MILKNYETVDIHRLFEHNIITTCFQNLNGFPMSQQNVFDDQRIL